MSAGTTIARIFPYSHEVTVSTRPTALAPAWLREPADPNELVEGVWPDGAARDADGCLVIGGVPASEIARRFGTPAYVVDEGVFRARARRTRRAFEAAAAAHGTDARVYYAGKALLTSQVAAWAADEGLRVDVCTGGELAVALAGGASPSRIGFHGNNKTPDELRAILAHGVGSLVLDSRQELERLRAALAERSAPDGAEPLRVLVRVNSGVHADTHAFLATAHEDQKFGVPAADAPALVADIARVAGLVFDGFHGHIGSQIFGVAGFREAASRLVALHADEVAAAATAGREGPGVLNLGGGFGIAYTAVDDPAPIEDLASGIVEAVASECRARGIALPTLAFEPGRTIAGPAGVTLYTVGTTKPVAIGGADAGSGAPDAASRLYVSVDGGMSDNARYALYGAEYSARLASRRSDAPPTLSRIVGSHCESGDIVVDAEYLPADVAPGDLLAVPATGAYCFSLASTYNWMARPPVVAVRDGDVREIVRRVGVDDLLAFDVRAPRAAAEASATASREGDR